MKPILSFKLLLNRNVNGVGISLVSGTLVMKFLMGNVVLMLFPSIFAIPRKVGPLVQILMTLDSIFAIPRKVGLLVQILMTLDSVFAIPWKVGLLVQMLMKLDTWSLSSLPEMSLLFLRFIRLYETSQKADALLRAATWNFCTLRSLLRPWAFICSCQISLLHFFTSKSEQFWVFHLNSF